MHLYLLRHGQAGNKSEWKGDDSKRPLTTEGRHQVERVAEALADLGVCPDTIITSPYARAAQTAEIAAAALKSAVLLTDGRLVPGSHPGTIAEIAAEHGSDKTVMIVGHDPHFSRAIESLTGARVVLKKSAVARIELDGHGAGTLCWLVQPRVLER